MENFANQAGALKDEFAEIKPEVAKISAEAAAAMGRSK